MLEAAVKDKMVQIWISETTGVQPIITPACNLIGFHKLNRVGLSEHFELKKKKKKEYQKKCVVLVSELVLKWLPQHGKRGSCL